MWLQPPGGGSFLPQTSMGHGTGELCEVTASQPPTQEPQARQPEPSG
jgi:hypothetical protein